MADDKQLSPEGLKEFQNALKEAILTADKAIYDTAQQLPSTVNKIDSFLEDVLTFNALSETKKRILAAYSNTVETWELQKKGLWGIVGSGTIEGRPVTEKSVKMAFDVVTTNIRLARDAISNVNQYAKGTVLPVAVGTVFAGFVEVLNVALEAVFSLLKGTVKVIGSAGTALGWLPWIIGGVIVVPFLLRTFSAYKKGGASAAAEEAAGSIERGRSAAASAVSSGVRKFATRNPLAGASRRRRR